MYLSKLPFRHIHLPQSKSIHLSLNFSNKIFFLPLFRFHEKILPKSIWLILLHQNQFSNLFKISARLSRNFFHIQKMVFGLFVNSCNYLNYLIQYIAYDSFVTLFYSKIIPNSIFTSVGLKNSNKIQILHFSTSSASLVTKNWTPMIQLLRIVIFRDDIDLT